MPLRNSHVERISDPFVVPQPGRVLVSPANGALVWSSLLPLPCVPHHVSRTRQGSMFSGHKTEVQTCAGGPMVMTT